VIKAYVITLEGPDAFVNFGWRVRVFSAQFAWDNWGPNMTYVLSYGGPLPTGNISTGVGYGLALSYCQTNTWVP
jgi:hypothetical protein